MSGTTIADPNLAAPPAATNQEQLATAQAQAQEGTAAPDATNQPPANTTTEQQPGRVSRFFSSIANAISSFGSGLKTLVKGVLYAVSLPFLAVGFAVMIPFKGFTVAYNTAFTGTYNSTFGTGEPAPVPVATEAPAVTAPTEAPQSYLGSFISSVTSVPGRLYRSVFGAPTETTPPTDQNTTAPTTPAEVTPPPAPSTAQSTVQPAAVTRTHQRSSLGYLYPATVVRAARSFLGMNAANESTATAAHHTAPHNAERLEGQAPRSAHRLSNV